MPSRWRRILVPLAAGVSVALVLALLTIVVDDKPLFGLNPDVHLAVAGILAAVFGVLGYAETAGMTGTAVAWGGVLGAGGFLLAAGAGMAVFAATSSPYAAYAGWTVETDFDEEFNATTARDALEAQGFNITHVGSERIEARNDSAWVVLDAVGQHGADPSNVAFRMTVEYHADGEDVGSAEKARRQATEARPAFEEGFQAFLATFEERTGWTHVGEAEWQPLIVVS